MYTPTLLLHPSSSSLDTYVTTSSRSYYLVCSTYLVCSMWESVFFCLAASVCLISLLPPPATRWRARRASSLWQISKKLTLWTTSVFKSHSLCLVHDASMIWCVTILLLLWLLYITIAIILIMCILDDEPWRKERKTSFFLNNCPTTQRKQEMKKKNIIVFHLNWYYYKLCTYAYIQRIQKNDKKKPFNQQVMTPHSIKRVCQE